MGKDIIYNVKDSDTEATKKKAKEHVFCKLGHFYKIKKSLLEFNFKKEKSIENLDIAINNFLKETQDYEENKSFLCDEWVILKKRNIAMQKIYVTDALGNNYTVQYVSGYNKKYGEKVLALCNRLIYVLLDNDFYHVKFNVIEIHFLIDTKSKALHSVDGNFYNCKNNTQIFECLFGNK